MYGLEKVCLECGNETFYARQIITQIVKVDGDGQKIEVVQVKNVHQDEEIECDHCRKVYPSKKELVTAQYFHEVICAQEGE